jgi:hypothetical protein
MHQAQRGHPRPPSPWSIYQSKPEGLRPLGRAVRRQGHSPPSPRPGDTSHTALLHVSAANVKVPHLMERSTGVALDVIYVRIAVLCNRIGPAVSRM